MRASCNSELRRHSSLFLTGSSLFPLVLSLLLVGCTHPRAATPAPAATPTLEGDPAHPASTQGWVRTELYFGLGPADHPDEGISEAQWLDFVDHEVTPRFPAGLSAVNMYGQWQGKGAAEPSRLRSKVLIILYPGTAENSAKIDAIRAAWKQRTGDRSVLRVTQPADVSF
jgi:hypothetical protein